MLKELNYRVEIHLPDQKMARLLKELYETI